MERNVNPNQEGNEVAGHQQQSVQTIDIDNSAPPAYSGGSNITEPPAYSVAVKLPTYEEFEQTKNSEHAAGVCAAPRYITDTVSDDFPAETTELNSGANFKQLVGTDNMFIVGFILGFLFNWFGLLISLCLLRTLAGRCGALSGFGLSVVKWALIVKSRSGGWIVDGNHDDTMFWWLMLTFGVLMISSGAAQYIRAKYRLTGRGSTFVI